MAEQAIRVSDDPASIGMRLLRKHLESGYSVKKQLERYSGKMRADIASAYGDQALKRGEYQTAMKAYEIAKKPEKLLALSSAVFSEGHADEKSTKAALKSMQRARGISKQEKLEHGKTKDGNFYSKSLGKQMQYKIYLPPGYENSKERYPAIYIFAGANENHEYWTKRGEIDRMADDLISKGLIKKVIIVMPDVPQNGVVLEAEEMPKTLNPKLTRMFLKHGATPGMDEYISKDFVSEIDSKFRTIADRTGRATEGFSLGATNSVIVALKHPDKFLSAAGHGGVYGKPELPKDAGKVQLYLDAPMIDAYSFPQTKSFIRQLNKAGIKYVFDKHVGKPGAMTKDFWKNVKRTAKGEYNADMTLSEKIVDALFHAIAPHSRTTIIQSTKDSLMYHSINFENAAKKKVV